MIKRNHFYDVAPTFSYYSAIAGFGERAPHPLNFHPHRIFVPLFCLFKSLYFLFFVFSSLLFKSLHFVLLIGSKVLMNKCIYF